MGLANSRSGGENSHRLPTTRTPGSKESTIHTSADGV